MGTILWFALGCSSIPKSDAYHNVRPLETEWGKHLR